MITVVVAARMLYLDVRLRDGHDYALPAGNDELAVYVVGGSVEISGSDYAAGVMAIAAPGAAPVVRANGDAHFMVIGGETLGPRHVWWNFASSSRERIERAKRDWTENRFDEVPGETEFIPLPDD